MKNIKIIEDQTNFSKCLFNKFGKLKQAKDTFQNNQLTNLNKDKLEQIMQIQNSIEINDFNCSSTEMNSNFSSYSLPAIF